MKNQTLFEPLQDKNIFPYKDKKSEPLFRGSIGEMIKKWAYSKVLEDLFKKEKISKRSYNNLSAMLGSDDLTSNLSIKIIEKLNKLC